MRVTKQLRTETGHRLVDYDGRCAHLHGHSYLWEVTCESHTLTHNGMVVDFKDLKKAMNTVIDPLDHAMVLSPKDKLCNLPHYEDINELLVATNGASPRVFIWHENPTAESFAAWAGVEIQWVLDRAGVPINVVKVVVWETATSYAEWQA